MAVVKTIKFDVEIMGSIPTTRSLVFKSTIVVIYKIYYIQICYKELFVTKNK